MPSLVSQKGGPFASFALWVYRLGRLDKATGGGINKRRIIISLVWHSGDGDAGRWFLRLLIKIVEWSSCVVALLGGCLHNQPYLIMATFPVITGRY